MSAGLIRVVLAEDQMIVRRGISALLNTVTQDIRVVAEASDGVEVLEVVRESKPDLVLMDVRMPNRNGIDAINALRQAGLLAPVILLTTFDDDQALLDGIRAGARGFLMKDVSVERLADAIRAVVAGETAIRPAVTERILRRIESQASEFDSSGLPEPLTPRETEILRLMAGGFSNREIADAVCTAEGTVKNHASSILAKMGVRDRTRAVLKGFELGYL